MSADAVCDRRAVHPVEASIVVFRGYSVSAPGFTTASFKRAADRALAEGVHLAPADRPGEFRASRPGSSSAYLTTATACSCQAGQLGRPCKHSALAALLTAITGGPRGP